MWFENLGGGAFSKHAIGLDQGPGFMITAVEDLLGDGITRWVATNHSNQNVPFVRCHCTRNLPFTNSPRS
ncbi:MAG: hypothetical protein H6986_01635 [Pseudomonadales bacterium]|nr:hypothetical protein [Pseudomonadales bacterium]